MRERGKRGDYFWVRRQIAISHQCPDAQALGAKLDAGICQTVQVDDQVRAFDVEPEQIASKVPPAMKRAPAARPAVDFASASALGLA